MARLEVRPATVFNLTIQVLSYRFLDRTLGEACSLRIFRYSKLQLKIGVQAAGEEGGNLYCAASG